MAAATWKTAPTPHEPATAGSTRRASMIPTGQALMRMVMAQIISRPANQSVSILVRSTLRRIAPAAETARPIAIAAKPPAAPMSALPVAIRARPVRTTRRSPNRAPKRPPGNEKKIPGSENSPMSHPRSTFEMWSRSMRRGDTAPTDWNWKPMAVRATVRTASAAQRPRSVDEPAMAHRSRRSPAAIGQPTIDDGEASSDQRHARGLPRIDVLAERGDAQQDRIPRHQEDHEEKIARPRAGEDAEPRCSRSIAGVFSARAHDRNPSPSHH